MDDEYRMDSEDRLAQSAGAPAYPEPGYGAGYDHAGDGYDDSTADYSASAGGGAGGGAGAGGEPSDGPAADGATGDEPEATRFSSGVKLEPDYYMVSQTNAGEISLYNPFTSETFALQLPAVRGSLCAVAGLICSFVYSPNTIIVRWLPYSVCVYSCCVAGLSSA